MTRPTILCVDDYEASLGGWCLYLQAAGYSVTTARAAHEALELFAVSPVDLVLLDYVLPDGNGGEVAETMRRINPHVRIVIFPGAADIPTEARCNVDFGPWQTPWFFAFFLPSYLAALAFAFANSSKLRNRPLSLPLRPRQGHFAVTSSVVPIMNTSMPSLPSDSAY